MRNNKWFLAVALMMALSWLVGCGGAGSVTGGGGSFQQTGSVFTVATDAPLPSVVSCTLTVNSITLFNGTTNVNVLSQPAVIDFARLNGLHQLIDLSTVAIGTYTSATLTVASPVIRHINTSVDPPTIDAIPNATLTQTEVTVAFAKPFVLSADDLVGLRMEFDLRQSLLTDNGELTGVVAPTFHMRLLAADHADVFIDDFRGGVVSVIDSNSFVMQGPHGRRWTVTTDPSTTDFATGERVSALVPNAIEPNEIVSVSGELNRVTHAIQATELLVISRNRFLVSGLFTSVRPPTGPATEVDLFVRSELPDISGISIGEIGTFNLNNSEAYWIAHLRSPLTTLLLNNSSLAAGQEVVIGGAAANGGASLVPKRVILLRQGQAGTLNPGHTVIVAGNTGSFELNAHRGIASLLLPNPLTVRTSPFTRFINLGGGLGDLTGNEEIRLRAVGFVLIDPSLSEPVLVARVVEKLPLP